jgi:hypothetical protein
MPQDLFDDDGAAFQQLGQNFKTSRGGIIYPVDGYTPTPLDLKAVDYLVLEWDYGYDPNFLER